MTIAFRIGATTDVGAQRSMNQDSYAVAPQVVVVADGMGGHRGGEVASSLAVQEMMATFVQPDLGLLVTSVEQANRRILDAAAANPLLHGMGTTVVALALIEVPSEPDLPNGISLGAVNVGDSRMYRLTGNVLEQLTEDHSLVEALVREGRLTPEQAEVHPQRNIVTRALGVIEHVEVDHFHFIPKVGDRYLLASDGLFDEVSAQEIATLLATYTEPQEAADALVVAANASGGRDNITTVVVDIVEPGQGAMPAAPASLANDAIIAGESAATSDAPQASAPDEPLDDSPTGTPLDGAGSDSADFDVPQARGEKQRWSWRR